MIYFVALLSLIKEESAIASPRSAVSTSAKSNASRTPIEDEKV
jgi:hypothetical protein